MSIELYIYLPAEALLHFFRRARKKSLAMKNSMAGGRKKPRRDKAEKNEKVL